MSLHHFNTADDIVEIDPTTLVTSTWSYNTNDLNIQTQWTASSQGGNDGMTSPTSSGTFFISNCSFADLNISAKASINSIIP